MARLRVALLWPSGFDPKAVLPLAMGFLKSNLDGLHDVRLIDCALHGLRHDSPQLAGQLVEFDPQVVGVGTWSPMFPEALELLRLARRILPRAVTVIGGNHATSYTARVMANPEIDFLFRGEAERSFPLFLEQLQAETPDWPSVRGLTYRTPDGGIASNEMDQRADLDSIRFPDYDFIDLDGYLGQGYRLHSPAVRNAPVWTERACPYRCQYCSSPLLNGKPIRRHGMQHLSEWVLHLYHHKKIRYFNVIDDNFTFNKEHAKEFCRMVISLGLEGVTFATPNGIRMDRGDPELWSLMRRAGWKQVVVSPESGSPRTLALMKKDLDLEKVPRIIGEMRDAGLKVLAAFVVGYPGETPADIRQTGEFIRRSRFNMVFLNNFQPLPGTPIYDQLVREGKMQDGLLPRDYSDGARAYTSEELRGFNFPAFVLKTYLGLAVREPRNVPFILSMYSPFFLLRKVRSNVTEMVRGRLGRPPA